MIERPPRVPIAVERAIAGVIMGAIACITFANVVVRYATDRSFAFTEEYSVVLMVIMTLVGSSAAFAADRHIRMSYLVDKLSPRPRRLIEIGTVILSIVLFAAIAGWGAQLTWDEYRFEVSSPGLGMPQWIYTGWVPVLAAASVLRLLGRLKRVRDARA